MVTMVHTDDFRSQSHPNLLLALRAAWQGYRQRRADRRALALAGLRDARLLADMGLDPDAVRAATSGAWDDLSPNGFLVHRRW
jgi:hypothetical protein